MIFGRDRGVAAKRFEPESSRSPAKRRSPRFRRRAIIGLR
jgi:hypothetical protein